MKNFASRLSNLGNHRFLTQYRTPDVGMSLLVVVVAIPMFWVCVYALAYSFGMVGILSHGWTMRHWDAALRNGGVVQAIVLSVSIAGFVTACSTTIAIAMVIALPRLRQQPIFLAALCVAMGTPSAITAFLVYQFLSGGGLLARIAHRFTLIESPTDFPQFVNDPFAIGIVIAQLFGTVPLLFLYFSQLWKTIKADRLCEVARSFGASRWQMHSKVALPMLLARGRAMILLVFLISLGSYETPLLLGRQSPQMFSVLTQRQSGIYNLGRRPEAFVLATIYFTLCAVTLVAYLRWRRRSA